MGLRRATPMTFRPAGLSDALDGSPVFSGAMQSLANLIPDPTTKHLWQCRPAAISKTTFSTFNTPGFISCMQVVGNRVFGMIASQANPGHDEPFAYDLITQTFIAITGVTLANTPISPATSGAWTPPNTTVVGTKFLVTHPGFTGVGGVWFGYIDISNPAALTWTGTDLTGAITFNSLGVAPLAVQQFNNRAWYIANPATGQPSVIYSDVLVPTNVTNASQALTFDDNVPLTAMGPLPLNNQLGGVIQALIVFKGTTNLYQITGDAALSTLARNSLNIATGTLAPNTVTTTPFGLAFVAPDGLRVIDFQARVSDPVGYDGGGKTLPFIYSVIPSRMCAACNGNVIRISVQDASLTGSPTKEYWYDLVRKIWSGPHTFPASLISAWNNTFIMAPQAVTAALFQSDVVQTSTSTFTENGSALTFAWTSCMLPDTDQMAQYAMCETTIYMAFAGLGQSYLVQALDQDGAVLNSASVAASGSPTVWGAFTWGSAVWGGQQNALFPRSVQWSAPVEFRRMAINVTGTSDIGFKISTMHLKYQKLGYLQEPLVTAVVAVPPTPSPSPTHYVGAPVSVPQGSTYNVQVTDTCILITAGTVTTTTITLPDAASMINSVLIRDLNGTVSTTAPVNINPSGIQKIDGLSTVRLAVPYSGYWFNPQKLVSPASWFLGQVNG